MKKRVRIEYNPPFDALLQQGVPVAIALCGGNLGQTGSVHGSDKFTIERGVKQSHVISPILFNAGLEHAMQKWERPKIVSSSGVGWAW